MSIIFFRILVYDISSSVAKTAMGLDPISLVVSVEYLLVMMIKLMRNHT